MKIVNRLNIHKYRLHNTQTFSSPTNNKITVIDLSSLDPEELLDSGKIEEIPQCSFIEKPSSKKKATTSRKRQKKQLAQTRLVTLC